MSTYRVLNQENDIEIRLIINDIVIAIDNVVSFVSVVSISVINVINVIVINNNNNLNNAILVSTLVKNSLIAERRLALIHVRVRVRVQIRVRVIYVRRVVRVIVRVVRVV